VASLQGDSVGVATALSPVSVGHFKSFPYTLIVGLGLNVPYQGVGLVTTQRVLARKRDIARRFVKAFVEAIHMVKTNPEAAKRAYVKYRKLKDEKEAEAAYETLREVVKAKPYPSVEGFKTILADLSEKVPAAKNANPKFA